MPANLNQEIKTVLSAIATDDKATLETLLQKHPEIAADPRPLSNAALAGNVHAVGLLLANGADPNSIVKSHEGYRPLHRAIEHRGVSRNPGQRECVRLLLDAGAEVMARAAWMSITAPATAGLAGDEDIIALVLSRSPEPDIYTAAILADADRVGQWLKQDSALAVTPDVNQMTVLHYAALSGLKGEQHAVNQRRIVELLLAAGANPDAQKDIGPYKDIPVLHLAAWGNITVARALLENGANPNLGFGNTLWREPGEMATLFLTHGADPNSREPSGQPFLNNRIHWNLPSVAIWLLENGADPNLMDAAGNTALHEAAKKGINPKVVTVLLEKGARLDAKNDAGKSPLDVAREHGKTKVVDLLTA